MSEDTSYWQDVWSRATQNVLFKLVHDVATSHTERLMNKYVVRHAEEPKSICELGSGSGNGSMYIASKFDDIVVTLVDTNLTILESAQEAYKKRDIPLKIRNEDLFNLDDSIQYDIVHSGGLLEHFTNPVDVFNIHVNLTKKGGITFISIPRSCWYWNGFLAIMKLVKGEFVDQKNYTCNEFINVVKEAYRRNPTFKIVDFSCSGIDIVITARKIK